MDSELIALLGASPQKRLETLKAQVKRYPHYGGILETYRQGFRPLAFRHWPVDANDRAYAARRFFGSATDAGLRFEAWADDVLRLRYTGWYADELQDETFRGAVFRLPAGRKGRERFVAGYGESLSEGFVLDLTEVWDGDFIGAAREADRLAERAAEDARAWQARESARLRLEDIAGELTTVRKDILNLCRSIREACPALAEHKPIREALRGALQNHLRHRLGLCEERDRLQAEYPGLGEETARAGLGPA
ncbi:MAG: hypothetical protein COW30_00430 [Rhodospirillales bacterium CG15_BIG_FIL_POST_REV_8_21_14_020_66_15]|nr:MAG: hypothetical protein COW30_00430 [Rhodospirillales bacterium CG15_BIG_FIL_POST_REV_8_21_14_020_66_15]